VSYSTEILRAADKFLDKLSKQQPSDAEAIEEAIEGISETPRPPGCKPLKGYAGTWRIRVGSYRVCYQVDESVLLVLVVTVSTRDKVYDTLRRYLGR
jgi:mRNA interferase RelE/StbE